MKRYRILSIPHSSLSLFSNMVSKQLAQFHWFPSFLFSFSLKIRKFSRENFPLFSSILRNFLERLFWFWDVFIFSSILSNLFLLPPNFFVSISFLQKLGFVHQSLEALSMASFDSTSITIDESHPFFLHHAENPGVILVSQPLTGGENYPTWARSMERALRIKSKF